MDPKISKLVRRFLLYSPLYRTSNDFIPIIAKRRFSKSSPVVVQQILKKVQQYGKLVVDVPWNVNIRSTDSHESPCTDTLHVTLSLSGIRHIDESAEFVSVAIKDNRCEITANKHTKIYSPGDMQCLVELPIQYDVDARTDGNADIKISNMVSESITIATELGNISGRKLQAKSMKFSSNQGGSIDLGHSLQGDIEIKTTKNGSIKAEKCLGTSLEVTTENGDVTLGSNYCEKSSFTTVNGDLKLNNLHMDATVGISGHGALNVSCLDGSLQAKIGDGGAKVQLVRLSQKSHIISGGPVHLIVPKDNNVQLNLKGDHLLVDESLSGEVSNSDGQQVLTTNGTIPMHVETKSDLRVTIASWAESLQIGRFMK